MIRGQFSKGGDIKVLKETAKALDKGSKVHKKQSEQLLGASNSHKKQSKELKRIAKDLSKFKKGGKTQDWLFVGSYPTGTTYSDRTKSEYGDYKQIAYVYNNMQTDFEGGKLIKYRLAIYSDDKKYHTPKQSKDLKTQYG